LIRKIEELKGFIKEQKAEGHWKEKYPKLSAQVGALAEEDTQNVVSVSRLRIFSEQQKRELWNLAINQKRNTNRKFVSWKAIKEESKTLQPFGTSQLRDCFREMKEKFERFQSCFMVYIQSVKAWELLTTGGQTFLGHDSSLKLVSHCYPCRWKKRKCDGDRM
jgi:hypothetical protein